MQGIRARADDVPTYVGHRHSLVPKNPFFGLGTRLYKVELARSLALDPILSALIQDRECIAPTEEHVRRTLCKLPAVFQAWRNSGSLC